MIKLILNDGGRSAAGYKGDTGDCVVRAIAIAFKKDYTYVYDLLNESAKDERLTKRHTKRSSSRNGVAVKTFEPIIESWGAKWHPCMTIGSGCTTHLKASELPAKGRYILRVSKHVCAWVDGELHDTYDCSRAGTRCVYGYWSIPE
jgi:hypothetical protein